MGKTKLKFPKIEENEEEKYVNSKSVRVGDWKIFILINLNNEWWVGQHFIKPLKITII